MKMLKNTSLALTGSAILAAAMFLGTPVNGVAGGTDILHFTVSTSMTNSGVEPNADGKVQASQKEQGKADNQKLSINVSGLTINTTYGLVVTYDNDTNLVDTGTFTTDNKGKADIDYVSLGKGHGGGKKKIPLPDSLNPVSLIRGVGIVDTNLQVVLAADLSSPDKLDYLIKRGLNNGDVDADLLIHATANKTQFRLKATGLTPDTDYLLAFNGEVVQTNTSNAKGKLNIDSLTEVPPYILDVRLVELLDTSTNVILSAELP